MLFEVGVKTSQKRRELSLRMAYSMVIKVFSWNKFKTVAAGPIFPSLSEKSNLLLVSKRGRKRTAAA